MRLTGKKALITGAGGGIGRAAALAFGREGAAVACCDIKQDAAEATAEALRAIGGTALPVIADLTNEDAAREALEAAERQLGGLDTVFNNAGLVHPEDQGAADTPLSAWNATLAVNLTSVFLVCKFAVPALLRAGGGSVVNNASIVALVGSAYPQIAYTAAKGGVASMTRELAVVHARQGLRFNAICPGPTGTELVRTFLSDEAAWAKRRPYMPQGRLAEPEEIAAVALFLASDEASYLNGALLPVDGGITAAYVIDDSQEP
ncbi:SDR family oxidoreductase [Algihabitans albus]|uniref:SDR family oxidoreductase n=1 Tax=Algihabitans albus TaxID=2164067 RepID=UPI000E5C9A5B|nr:SDR family oxidoreductase [Algihabitans albus]